MFENQGSNINIALLVNNFINTMEGRLEELAKEATKAQEVLDKSSVSSSAYSELLSKYNKLYADYTKSLEAYEISKKECVPTPSTGVLFDPAIHSHKPFRPITKAVKLKILDAYENVYKKDEDCKTLSDFFSWVQANIHASVSRSEIEGVIYNRFDDRLYQD